MAWAPLDSAWRYLGSYCLRFDSTRSVETRPYMKRAYRSAGECLASSATSTVFRHPIAPLGQCPQRTYFADAISDSLEINLGNINCIYLQYKPSLEVSSTSRLRVEAATRQARQGVEARRSSCPQPICNRRCYRNEGDRSAGADTAETQVAEIDRTRPLRSSGRPPRPRGGAHGLGSKIINQWHLDRS